MLGLAATTLNGDAEKSKLNSWLCYTLWSGSEPGSYFHLSVFPFSKRATRFFLFFSPMGKASQVVLRGAGQHCTEASRLLQNALPPLRRAAQPH